MRKTFAMVMTGLCLSATISVSTAEKPSDAYVKSMKDVGAGVQSATAAMKAEDFAAVQASAGSIIQALTVAQKYWASNEDATKLVQTASKAASDLRVAASLASGEGMDFSMKELTATCGTCHTAHREKLPDGTFQIK